LTPARFFRDVKPLTLQRHGLQIDSAGVVAGVVVPVSPLSPGSGNAADWRPVRKRRRGSRFSLVSGQIVARAPGLQQEPGCEVELTEIRTRGQDWWTLGFGTTGPADLLRRELEATAALVFDEPLPGGVEPGPDDSRSYAEWLDQRPGTGSDDDA
jgi:hypothetical protein